MGVIQVREISMTCCWERRRPRRPIIGKRRATAYPTVSERTLIRLPCLFMVTSLTRGARVYRLLTEAIADGGPS